MEGQSVANRQYTVYDNVDGGYTIRYKYVNALNRRDVYSTYQANNRESMMRFTKDLERKGFKFVGKL